MAKSTQDLFLLIKSMSRGEKRHFRLSVKKYEKRSNYLQLFDALDKQQEYDEEHIRRMFPEDIFNKKLSAAKEYLYTLVLSSLRDYETDSSPTMEIMILRHAITTLNNRRLYTQAARMIEKARSLCIEYELYEDMLHIHEEESSLPSTDILQYFEEYRKTLEKVNNMYICAHFAEHIRQKTEGRGALRSLKERQELDYIVQEFPVQSVEEALTATAKISYYLGFASYYYLIGDYEEQYCCLRVLLKLFHQYPAMLIMQTNSYLGTIRMLCANRIRTGHDEKALEVIDELRNAVLPLRFAPLQTISVCLLDIIYSSSTLDLERGVAVIRQYPGILQHCRQEIVMSDMDFDVIIRLEATYIYFMKGDYSLALDQVHLLLQKPTLNSVRDEGIVRILFLILHYERGNTELLEYIIRSTYRFFVKQGSLHAFERSVLRALRRLSSVHTHEDLMTCFQCLYDELQTLISDPVEHEFLLSFLRRFQFLPWLESKITGRCFLDILREKRAAQGRMISSMYSIPEHTSLNRELSAIQ